VICSADSSTNTRPPEFANPTRLVQRLEKRKAPFPAPFEVAGAGFGHIPDRVTYRFSEVLRLEPT